MGLLSWILGILNFTFLWFNNIWLVRTCSVLNLIFISFYSFFMLQSMMLESSILNLNQPLSRGALSLIIKLCCLSIIELVLEVLECLWLFLSVFAYFIHFLPNLINIKVKVILFRCQIEVLSKLRLIEITEFKVLPAHTMTVWFFHFGVSNSLQCICSWEIKPRLLRLFEGRHRLWAYILLRELFWYI